MCCHVNVVAWLLWWHFVGPLTGDALLKPQLLKMLPFVLHRLTITLQPSLEMFESQLLQLINADYHNTVRPSFSGFRSSQIPGGNRGHREETRITTNHILVDHLLCPKIGSGSACIYRIADFSCWRFTNRWMPVLKCRHYTYKANPNLHPPSITLQIVLCFQGRK